MLNLEGEQTSLKSLVTNTEENFSRVNSEENLKTGTFKLLRKVGMTPLQLYILA